MTTNLSKQARIWVDAGRRLLCAGNWHGFYKWGSTNAYLEDEAA